LAVSFQPSAVSKSTGEWRALVYTAGMRLATSVLIVLSLTSCTAYKAPKHSTWKNTTSLEAMERLYWQAIKDKDWNNVESHTASTYTHLSNNGVMSKEEALAVLRQADLVEFSLGDFQITDNAGTSVVTYSVTFTVDFEGKRTGPMTIHRMTVWQQQKKGWARIADADSAPATSVGKM
jgi:hypothetical protein